MRTARLWPLRYPGRMKAGRVLLSLALVAALSCGEDETPGGTGGGGGAGGAAACPPVTDIQDGSSCAAFTVGLHCAMEVLVCDCVATPGGPTWDCKTVPTAASTGP
jgi:hypothetical protein